MNAMVRLLGFGLFLCLPGISLAAQEKSTTQDTREAQEIAQAEKNLDQWRLQEVRLRMRHTEKEAIARQLREQAAQEAHAELQEREQLETGIGLSGCGE